jgi:hypothetical protein
MNRGPAIGTAEVIMNFAGRWIPLELANTIFIAWLVSVIVLAVVVFWIVRKPPHIDRKRSRPRRVGGKSRYWRFKR